MATSVGPEMKFFRWILSHLMLIIVLSLVIYVYWNRSEIWSEEASVENNSEQLVKPPVPTKQTEDSRLNETLSVGAEASEVQDANTQNTAYEELSADKSALKAAIESPNRADVRSSSDFSERMKHYRQTLPVEEREIMDKAESIFQQASDGIIKYPVESDIEVKPENLENIEDLIAVENDAAEQFSGTQEDSTQQAIDSAKEVVIIVNETETNDSQENELNEDYEVVISQSPVLSAQNTKENSPEENSSEGQTENLQQQIRNRQKQLQSQLVMLIPFGSENSSEINSDDNKRSSKKLKKFKPVKSVINTPQQRRLLKEARKAFDDQRFAQAEEKYLQVINQLPGLPDAVGELANVYRTQNKTSEYLITNTQFVERLVNHNRFNEAWKVVKATDKLDKEVAEQQRQIIKRKQEY